VVSQRNTLAVDHHHPLCALAPAGLADTEPPFLAGAKLPSIKASDQSNCPRWSNSARNARHALSHTPCSSQSFSRRQHVEGLGYSLGKSAHGAPVRKTQRIPSKTLRLSIQGRPRESLRRLFGCRSRDVPHASISGAWAIMVRSSSIASLLVLSVPSPLKILLSMTKSA
jgi:hypothetical protein